LSSQRREPDAAKGDGGDEHDVGKDEESVGEGDDERLGGGRSGRRAEVTPRLYLQSY